MLTRSERFILWHDDYDDVIWSATLIGCILLGMVLGLFVGSRIATGQDRAFARHHWRQTTGRVIAASAPVPSNGKCDAPCQFDTVQYHRQNGSLATRRILADWHDGQGTQLTMWVDHSGHTRILDSIDPADEVPQSSSGKALIGGGLLGALAGLLLGLIISYILNSYTIERVEPIRSRLRFEHQLTA